MTQHAGHHPGPWPLAGVGEEDGQFESDVAPFRFVDGQRQAETESERTEPGRIGRVSFVPESFLEPGALPGRPDGFFPSSEALGCAASADVSTSPLINRSYASCRLISGANSFTRASRSSPLMGAGGIGSAVPSTDVRSDAAQNIYFFEVLVRVLEPGANANCPFKMFRCCFSHPDFLCL